MQLPELPRQKKRNTYEWEEVMLIDAYDLEVFTPACDPGAESYAARARLVANISESFPYLNATLRGAVYYPEAEALTWKKGGHSIAFHSYEIATNNVEDRLEAEQEVRELVDLVNRTWEQRAEIKPDTSTRQRPRPMTVFKLLPNTNCKQCGETTCYSFALKLTLAQKNLTDCLPLSEPRYAERFITLQEIVVDAPSIG
jgi:ArsR family metal-binding transcriptional regulator